MKLATKTYTVHELAQLAGVSVRTLHYYDEVGLLTPKRNDKNSYRSYGESELLVLQQILFFRELDFSIEEIKKIVLNKKFDMVAALQDQRGQIELRKKRLTQLTETIDKTIKKIKKEITMKDEELYKAFTDNGKKYAAEAKERWGNSDAYKQSTERVKKMSKEEMIAIQKAGDELMKEIAAAMDKGPKHPDVQVLIDRHYNALRKFYEPNMKLYRVL